MLRESLASCLSISVTWAVFCATVGAATLQGRVVDSAGRPIARVEVWIWQKVPVPGGRGARAFDQPIKFDGSDVLLTDAEGHFLTPDVWVGETFVRVTAEGNGTLAGRSAWIEIGNNLAAVVAPDIVVKRLRAVFGQVLDRPGQPIAGATVFNSGDGHERVETKTGRNGKFFLENVPEGPVFLFAEKEAYRFAGMHLAAGEPDADFTLSSVEEEVEPLATLPPIISSEEEIALARDVLDPWLAEVRRTGTDEQKFMALASLAGIEPLAALKLVDSWELAAGHRTIGRDGFLQLAVAQSGELNSELRAQIGANGAPFNMARHYVEVARHLPSNPTPGNKPARLELIEAALVHASQIDVDALRTEALALVADALFWIGEQERAEVVLTNAETVADELVDGSSSARAFGALALTAANSHTDRARRWMEKVQASRDYPHRGAELATRLVCAPPGHPELAEEVWKRTQAGGFIPTSRDLLPFPWRTPVYLPDFCERLATIDRPRAERIAEDEGAAALHVRGRGAISLGLAETDSEEARRMLESLVREALPRIAANDGSQFGPVGSRPVTAAWLLPIAERVAPGLCRELFWRSLALRLPRPRHDQFDDKIETTDLRLARMLARYDRTIAQALVEPFASRVASATYVGATELNSPHATGVAATVTLWARELTIAATHVDPRWSKDLLGRIPYGRKGSKFHPVEFGRQAFVWTLARQGSDRWTGGSEVCAGFWEPRAADAPK